MAETTPKLWTNGNEFVIAATLKEAVVCGINEAADDDHVNEYDIDFKPVAGDKVIHIQTDDGRGNVAQTADAWIAEWIKESADGKARIPAVVCSSEW